MYGLTDSDGPRFAAHMDRISARNLSAVAAFFSSASVNDFTARVRVGTDGGRFGDRVLRDGRALRHLQLRVHERSRGFARLVEFGGIAG